MLKKNVLKIISGQEFAKAINKHSSQVTRMPKRVPEEYRGKLLTACRNKLKTYQEAYEAIQ